MKDFRTSMRAIEIIVTTGLVLFLKKKKLNQSLQSKAEIITIV